MGGLRRGLGLLLGLGLGLSAGAVFGAADDAAGPQAPRAAESALPLTAPAPAGPAASAEPAAPALRSGTRPRAAAGLATLLRVPRLRGRMQAADIGLLINTADPYSLAVGEHYIAARGLRPEQVLRVSLPLRSTLSGEEFEALRQRIASRFGPIEGSRVQALALAWQQPYAVGCASITGALALGTEAVDCTQTCAATAPSPYFNSASLRPAAELGLRPAMLLAAPDEAAARALIDRGVAADGRLGLRGAPPVQLALLRSNDARRDVRSVFYPPPGPLRGLPAEVVQAAADPPPALDRVLLAQMGVARLPALDALQFVPGALADHLTSWGGALDGHHGQSTALAWIAAGATASHGTVSEPCNHLQKFPHPQVLLLHYLQGATAIEAYWKSVAWPGQSLFIGEPLAAPYARR
ncbi:TIGR03790 family protein [Aquariibacter lacus]|nr:TIGR03790 family protein [Piscinibacter lacus]